MNRWIEDISRVLGRAPTGALPLSLIIEELRREGVFLKPQDPWLLSALVEEKTRLRMISLPGGPWVPQEAGRPGLEVEADQDGDIPSLQDPWILLRRPPQGGFGRGESARTRIREGFQAWADEMDGARPAAVARWIHANLEGTRICRLLATGG